MSGYTNFDDPAGGLGRWDAGCLGLCNSPGTEPKTCQIFFLSILLSLSLLVAIAGKLDELTLDGVIFQVSSLE